MCTFYYPIFDADKEPKKMKTSEEFIKYYSTAYYNDCGYKVKGTKRNVGQNSRYVENIIDGLLKKTNKYDERDLVRILSWKIGKIKQIDSENKFLETGGKGILEPLLNKVSNLADTYPQHLNDKYKNAYKEYISAYDDVFKNIGEKQDGYIIYANKWLPSNWECKEKGDFSDVSCFPLIGAFGRKLCISELIKVITENEDLTKNAREKDPHEALNTLLVKDNNGEDAIKGIGTVYLLTVLYFLSNGKWPIYDRFADKALTAICENRKPSEKVNVDTLPVKSDYLKCQKNNFGYDVEKRIKSYKEKIIKAFGDYEKYKECRDIDRALWVYGHLFS